MPFNMKPTGPDGIEFLLFLVWVFVCMVEGDEERFIKSQKAVTAARWFLAQGWTGGQSSCREHPPNGLLLMMSPSSLSGPHVEELKFVFGPGPSLENFAGPKSYET